MQLNKEQQTKFSLLDTTKDIHVSITCFNGVWHCFTGMFTGLYYSTTATTEDLVKRKMIAIMNQAGLNPIFPSIEKQTINQ